MKTINGFTYSKEPFEGWKFKAKVELLFLDTNVNNKTLDIYTNCENKYEAESSINLLSKYNTVTLKIVNWSSKEEDEWTTKFIEETLKDF